MNITGSKVPAACKNDKDMESVMEMLDEKKQELLDKVQKAQVDSVEYYLLPYFQWLKIHLIHVHVCNKS